MFSCIADLHVIFVAFVKPTVFTDFSAFLKYDMHLYLHLKSYFVILHKFNKLEQPANKRRSLPLVWSVSHLCLVLLCCILDHGGSKAALVIKHGVPQVITQITLFLLWVMNLISDIFNLLWNVKTWKPTMHVIGFDHGQQKTINWFTGRLQNCSRVFPLILFISLITESVDHRAPRESHTCARLYCLSSAPLSVFTLAPDISFKDRAHSQKNATVLQCNSQVNAVLMPWHVLNQTNKYCTSVF